MRRLVYVAAVVVFTLGLSSTAQAGVTVTVQEVAGDVVAMGDGSMDLSGANLIIDDNTSGFVGENVLFLGATGLADLYTATSVLQPSPPFGSTGINGFADAGTGDIFGINGVGAVPLLFVPAGYSSGQPLSGTSTFVGETLNSLGLEAGIYRFEWQTSTFGVSDFFEIVVIAPPVGACCVSDGCLEATESSCTAVGGQYFGDGVACGAVACPPGPVTGACCINGGCVQLSSADCASVGGVYNGDASDCGGVVCDPFCLADITDANGGGPDGVVDVFDLLALLAAWGNCLP